MSVTNAPRLGALSVWPGRPHGYRPLAETVRSWVSAEPVRAAVAASGWEWPATNEPVALLEELAALSDGWDFRRRAGDRAGSAMERGDVPRDAALVGDRLIPEDVLLRAAEAFGLVRAQAPAGRFSHLVVLSGSVKACINRTRHAAWLLGNGVTADEVVVLGAHRLLRAAEQQDLADRLGIDGDSESAAVVAAASQAFGPAEAVVVWESAPDAGTEAQRLARTATYTWPDLRVVIAPSAKPDALVRANTAAQLSQWAAEAGIGQRHRVLLVTTQIYVPYQHIVGVQVLGLRPGCAVWTCGVDAGHAHLPTREFTGADYLQEFRTTLLAARSLLAEAAVTIS